MRISLRRKAEFIFDILVLAMFFYLLFNPKLALSSVTESIYLCASAIVPSLFIYMILARMIIAMPFTDMFFCKLGRYGIEAEVLILGLLCGFPVGAKSAVFLYENGTITKKRAEYICAFTNGASASFLLGYIGAVLFSDIGVGIRLAVYQLIASVITAAVFRILFMKKEDFISVNLPDSFVKMGGKFTEAVTDSAVTMISVCAFIITFSVLGEIAMTLINPKGYLSVFVKGFFEFSTGCAHAASLDRDTAFRVVSLLVGFSGLCVIMQVVSVIRSKLSAKMYFLGRFLYTAVLGLLSILFGI